MKVHTFFFKILLLPFYYTIHYNFFFGLIQKYFVKKFNYKKFSFELNIEKLPTAVRSSFLFNTYEYNDRKLVEKYIDRKNSCILIGGGIGFIPTLAYHKSHNKILVFEININIKNNLINNLNLNNCNYKAYFENLTFDEKKSFSSFYLSKNFLASSNYLKTSSKVEVKNVYFKKIDKFKDYNTLIIDGEGVEEYFILNLYQLDHIKYIFFELHNNIFNKERIGEMFLNLKKNNFELVNKCFNSYYFKRLEIK